METLPEWITPLISLLAATGLLGNVVVWFWKLGPRLQSLEAGMREANDDVDTLKKRTRDQVDQLKREHGERINSNERAIARLEGTVGRIDERTKGIDQNVQRILDRSEGR